MAGVGRGPDRDAAPGPEIRCRGTHWLWALSDTCTVGMLCAPAPVCQDTVQMSQLPSVELMLTWRVAIVLSGNVNVPDTAVESVH